MSYGLPVVAYNTFIFEEVIEDGKNSLFLKRVMQTIWKKLNALMNNKDLMNKYAKCN